MKISPTEAIRQIHRAGAGFVLMFWPAGTISPAVAVAAVALAALLLSEFMSNVAAVAVMLPLVVSIASQLGASPAAHRSARGRGADAGRDPEAPGRARVHLMRGIPGFVGPQGVVAEAEV